MLKNNLVSNNKVSRNSVYGKTYLKHGKKSFGSTSKMRKLKNKHVFGKNKEAYVNKGQYTMS